MYLYRKNKNSPGISNSTAGFFFIGVSFKQNNACSNPSETIRSGVEGGLVLRLSAC